MPLTATQTRELGGYALNHLTANGTSKQITAFAEAFFQAAKDFVDNGSAGTFDQTDRQEAMATLRDLAFEAATGKDATADAHEKGHWITELERFP